MLATPPTASACDCGPNCRCGPNCQCGPSPQTGPAGDELRVRKNAADLTDQERQDFIDALFALKTTTRPGATLSIYDEYVLAHGDAFANGQAHGASAFLPWHRDFLWRFEQDLQAVNPNVTIPYWDFTDPKATALVFSPKFLGGNGDPDDENIVKDGPFRGPSTGGQWELVFSGPDLKRDFGNAVPTLPTAADVQAAFGIGIYDAFPWDIGTPVSESFRNFLEGFNHPSGDPELHNRVHAWIGGSAAIQFSPNDPMFWLLHANIDRIWAEWQDLLGLPYLPVVGGPEGHNLHDPMSPFGATPASVLDHRALGYRYDTERATPIPEPSGFVLAAVGTVSLLAWRQRRRTA